MRRRRLLARRPSGGPQRALPMRTTGQRGGTDLLYLQHVVCVSFPVKSARTYLQRAIGNIIQVKLVEAGRGEKVGIVREVEIRHANSGDSTFVRSRRFLPSGEPASFFVPDHLVRVEPDVHGPAARTGLIRQEDVIVLHVPVRGYLRFLPGVFHGSGPVERRSSTRSIGTNALQRVGGMPAQDSAIVVHDTDDDFLKRFLFIFQHQMTTVTDRIDRIDELTDPLMCEAKFLPWLASWVGFDLDRSLPVHQQRELVRRAIRLYRTRGTRIGIEEMVAVLTSAPARVRERVRPSPMVLGRSRLAGGAHPVQRYRNREPAPSYLVAPQDHADTDFFVLLLEAREAFQERFGERASGVLRRIIDVVSAERPCHIAFTLRFDDSV